MSKYIPDQSFKKSDPEADRQQTARIVPTAEGARSIRAIVVACALASVLWGVIIFALLSLF